ncbi:MAG TPA: nuclear transport factor 2 family protein, partial [Chthonomonadaceae bacterium]|nr:nuclear transport factor 2 family protein [Chthonomonadaceae bacterium]
MKVLIGCVLAAICSAWCRAGAQESNAKLDREMAQAKALLPVYYKYMQAINTRGIAGLKSIAAPGFTMRLDHRSRTGREAFVEMRKIIHDPTKTAAAVAGDSIKLRQVTINGDRAIVQTAETLSFRSKPDSEIDIACTYQWKQTWRKTAYGWRLAKWETGADKLPGPESGVTYTVSWKPKESVP